MTGKVYQLSRVPASSVHLNILVCIPFLTLVPILWLRLNTYAGAHALFYIAAFGDGIGLVLETSASDSELQCAIRKQTATRLD